MTSATAVQLGDIIAESVCEVLETMFFTCIAGDSDTALAAGEESAAAWLSFRGKPSGRFTVVLSLGSANSVVASFLGLEEEEVDDTTRAETLNELANMLCGSVLSRLEGDSVFDLGAPEQISPSLALGGSNAGNLETFQRSFDMGDGILTVVLELERSR